MEIRQRNQMESEELLILCFQTDWTSLTEINLLPTWGLCSLHWAPHSIHGEPLFGSPRQTHRSQKDLWLWAVFQSPKPRRLGCGWLVASFWNLPQQRRTQLKQGRGFSRASQIWGRTRSAPEMTFYSNPLLI